MVSAVITGELKSRIDGVWTAFWSGGISNPLEVIEQITYLLFLRRLVFQRGLVGDHRVFAFDKAGGGFSRLPRQPAELPPQPTAERQPDDQQDGEQHRGDGEAGHDP